MKLPNTKSPNASIEDGFPVFMRGGIPYMTVESATSYMGKSTAGFYVWVNTHGISRVKHGRYTLYSKHDIDTASVREVVAA